MVRLVDTKLSEFSGGMVDFPHLVERSTEFHFDSFERQLQVPFTPSAFRLTN